MKIFTGILRSSILAFTGLFSGFILAQADYEEIGGVVVMEAESFDIAGTGWEVESIVSGATGPTKSYLRSPIGNYGSIVASTTIEVKIKINAPGRYIFKARTRVGSGTNPSEHNDTWVSFPDADAYYGEKPGSIVWPLGNAGNKTPNPSKGGGTAGYFKVYSASAAGAWKWFSRTCDGCSYAIFADFDEPKVYTMSISSRASDNLIDRIILSKKEEDTSIDTSVAAKWWTPIDAETEETQFVLAKSTLDLKKFGISIYPNPAQEQLTIQGLHTKTAIAIIDAYGRVFPATLLADTGALKQLDIAGLPQGLYFLKLQGLGHQAFLVE